MTKRTITITSKSGKIHKRKTARDYTHAVILAGWIKNILTGEVYNYEKISYRSNYKAAAKIAAEWINPPITRWYRPDPLGRSGREEAYIIELTK